MQNVTFFNRSEVSDELLKFAVISAKYNGKWILCRHKQRTTWEIPGGHREVNEDIADTAKRELYEETGAVEFDIKPVSIYGVTEDNKTTYGMLYFAEVKTLSDLPPEMEIGEIKLFDTLPKELTYTMIQPDLFDHTQFWLNLQSSPDEIWDIYDENRQPTGRTHRRADPLNSGDYHLVVYVWLQNSKGEFLLTKRTPNKGFPNMWECTGGSALTGDDSLTAALREMKEETGLSLLPQNGRCVLSVRGDNYLGDVWLFRQEFSLNDVVYQENETCGAMCATKDDILKMREDEKLVPTSYLDEFFKKIEE